MPEGIAIIQNPEDAEVSSMPRSALIQVQADYCVPLSEIGSLINRVTQTQAKTLSPTSYRNGGSPIPTKEAARKRPVSS